MTVHMARTRTANYSAEYYAKHYNEQEGETLNDELLLMTNGTEYTCPPGSLIEKYEILMTRIPNVLISHLARHKAC